jgi:hypothetical protein
VREVRADQKFALVVYLWGSITGTISGALSVESRAAWILGALLYVVTDVFVKLILRDDLPEDIKGLQGSQLRTAILKKAFWGWFLFWLYFTMLVYTVGIHFTPVPYNDKSLLSHMMNRTNVST